jgi:hypothetical protein
MGMNEQQRKELERLPNLLPWVVGIAFVMLVSAYVWAFNQLPSRESPPAWGSFGDYVGGLLNPLVSTFTLIVAVKVWQQQKVELRQTKEALEEQAKTAEQQRREQRFFDLLNLYQQALATLEVGGLRGRSAFTYQFRDEDSDSPLYRFTRHGFEKYTHYFKRNEKGRITRESEEKSVTKERLSASWNSFSPSFDHYFRTIFSILREAEPTLQSDHFRYVKLLRAQLGRDELVLLGFNSWIDSEGEKMIPYLCKYGLLKHLAQGPLRQQLEIRLPAAVFGRKWAKSQASTSTSAELILAQPHPNTPSC